MWTLGEFGQLLTNGEAKGPDDEPIEVSEREILALVDKVLSLPNIDETIQEYGLNCLIKLFPKYQSSQDLIRAIIKKYTTSSSMEVQ